MILYPINYIKVNLPQKNVISPDLIFKVVRGAYIVVHTNIGLYNIYISKYSFFFCIRKYIYDMHIPKVFYNIYIYI